MTELQDLYKQRSDLQRTIEDLQLKLAKCEVEINEKSVLTVVTQEGESPEVSDYSRSYAQERIRKLEEALKKYADPEHHISVVDGKVWEVFDNGYGVDDQEFGTWARKALEEEND